MKRAIAVLALLALPVCAAPTRYYVKPVYTSLRFSIVKWGVLKEEGIFRDFDGTLTYDPAHPEASRIDVVAKASSLDTKNENRDQVVTGSDFLDAERYPTIEFHSTGVDHNFVTGNLTIHGTTRRVLMLDSVLPQMTDEMRADEAGYPEDRDQRPPAG